MRLLEKTDFAAVALIQVFAGLGLQWQYAFFHSGVVQQNSLDQRQLAGLVRLGHWGGLISGAILVLLAGMLAWQFGRIDLLYLGLVSGVGLFAHATGGIYRSKLYRGFFYKKLIIIELCAFILSFVVTMATAWTDWGAFSLAAGFSTKYFSEALLNRHYSGGGATGERASFKELLPFLRFGRAHLAERLVTQLVFNLDYLLIGRLSGLEALGVYDVFKRTLVRPAALATEALERAVYPVYSRMQASGWRLRSLYLALVNAIGTLHIPVYLAVIVFAPEIIRLFFGESWLVYLVVFRLLAGFVVLHALINPVDHLLLALGRIGLWTKASLGYGVLISGMMVLIYPAGLTCMVTGMVGAHLVLWVVSWVIVHKALPGASLRQWPLAAGYPFLTAITAAFFPGIGWYAGLIGPGVFTAVFLGLYLYLAIRFNRIFVRFFKRVFDTRQ